MDGNGRWAAEHGLSRLEGHRAGADAVDAVVRASAEAGVEVLTLYAFSSENWSRPPEEVQTLFALLVEFLHEKTPELVENGMRLKALGRLGELPADARRALEEAERETSAGGRMTLGLAIAYGGQDEIVDSARQLARLAAGGKLSPDDIDRDAVAGHLYTAGLPPVDLLIRTGGERRVSNFLLWQISYAELYFTDVRWPEFTRERLEEALAEYARRERRFGATGAGESR
jgi:undecaprenyl diphosphate synthase